MKLLRVVLIFATLAVLVHDPARQVPAASSVSATTPAEPATAQAAVTARMAKLPLRFEANAGQWDERVRFVARQGGAMLSITDEGMTIGVRDVKPLPRTPGVSPDEENAARDRALTEAKSAAVSMKLVGAKARAPKGENELITKSNFFLGDDKTKWRTDVANYGQVRAKDWVPGVDVVWHGGDNGLEYDLEVAAGVDARELAFEIGGADRIAVAEDGALEIATSAGTLVQRPPRVVQDGRELPTRYVMRGAQRVGFAVDGYDDRLALLIDPVLTYSTYLGGSGADDSHGIAVDTAGNAYVTGSTQGSFPTVNAYQGTSGGANDAFVTKLNAAGNALVYSTYLGGTGYDAGWGVTVDAAGNAYVTGYTMTGGFPTANAFQGTYGGGNYDVFVTKLNAAGNALVYSTYLGGAGDDGGYGIAVDTAANAYLTGTTSGSYPTKNAFQGALGGDFDAFVTQLNAAGALVYSTYLGGIGHELGNGIAVDTAGDAYVTGQTTGSFPTANAHQGTFGGGPNDVFVTKLNAAGNGLVYSTYLGGAGTDIGSGMAVDTAGNAYVTGYTDGSFPTANGYQGTFAGGSYDAFVTKLNAAGTALVYSTYLGGAGGDIGQGIAVDTAGHAYVTGRTSGGFPTANAYQGTFGGGANDAFVTKLSAAGTALVHSTYLGGTVWDGGQGVAVDTAGNAYVTGFTYGSFPTANAYQGTFGGGTNDDFVVKFADPELAQGSPCAANGLCAPGLSCTDAVCCDNACTGECEACDVSGQVGTCTPVTGAPHGSRTACQSAATCTATCDGKNAKACTYGPDVCASTCSGGTESATLCDTTGACTVKKPRSCNNLVCADSNKCKDNCTSNADCLAGFACAPDGTCKPGATCIDDHTSKGANGVVQDCTPFKCETTGECKARCNSVDDCVAPDVCDPNGKCVPLTSSDSGGCSSSAGPAGSTPWLVLLGVFGASLVRDRRRRR